MRKMILAAIFVSAVLTGCDDDDNQPSPPAAMKTASGQNALWHWHNNKVEREDGRKGKMTIEWDYVPAALAALTILTLVRRRIA